MQIKWPFRKKDVTDTQTDQVAMPTEVQDYYQAEKRERLGVAWLLAGITLVATIAIGMGLFFGGRFVYRKLAHKNSPSTATTTPATTKNTPTTTETPKTATPDSLPGGEDQTAQTPSTTSAPSTATTSTPAATTTPATTPTTTLPNTGPDADL